MTATPTLPAVPIDRDLATKLRSAGNKAKEWTAERDRLIVEARRQGAPLREIAALVGLSHVAVDLIVKKAQRG